MKFPKYIQAAAAVILLAGGTACSDNESFSDMLRDEEHATNWYLSQHRVETGIPADSVFETGKDAPFYRMDEDGYLYMQVVNPGTPEPKPEDGEKVYFRFMRRNLKTMHSGGTANPEGNMDNMVSAIGNTSFVLGNQQLPSSVKWGTGIQTPLKFLGYDSEVNLVMRSYVGFASDQSQCIPYVVNVKYFRAEY